MALTPEVIDAVRRYDALIRKLQDYGLPPFDSKGYLAAFMAKRQQRADQYAEELRVWAEIEASLTPSLIAAYKAPDADGRQEIRDLLKQNRIFADFRMGPWVAPPWFAASQRQAQGGERASTQSPSFCNEGRPAGLPRRNRQP